MKILKWMAGGLLALLVLAGALLGYAMLTAIDSEHPVGFQLSQASGPDGKVFPIGVWYPTESRAWPTTPIGMTVMKVAAGAPIAGQRLPLVLISHGNGAGIPAHADLAMAMASAGYIVAAPMHGGDNFADQSAVGKPAWLSGRGQELKATLDHMLQRWPARAQIDPARVGAYGFSAGGFTVMSVIGAMPDLRLIAKHCSAAAEFACKLLAHSKSPLLSADTATMGESFVSDARIKVAAVAAPGLSFAFGAEGLAQVRVPVQLWSGDGDEIVPFATNGQAIQAALGAKLELHKVPGAGHFSFLAPCSGLAKLLAPPQLCEDAGQFDRKAFHRDMNASVVNFFDAQMKPR
ncbi:alpha/beta hydrolase family protein [Roseateles oligotrophus]|uniref:Dienelactone hydrolase n=1 Tax=Roseateles oligotrophus TaxID=1769250 RepID=A0ABT2YIK0_9BURK|nr:dienelactone hydrolase [Roseateles oligotrophus]MCV2369796.1 dienelactone hydrolase [Roseateles oligotrophus]